MYRSFDKITLTSCLMATLTHSQICVLLRLADALSLNIKNSINAWNDAQLTHAAHKFLFALRGSHPRDAFWRHNRLLHLGSRCS